MPLDLADYENKAREAVKAFWGNRAAAAAKQKELGREDQGERASVTGGKNMDGFIALIQDVIRANGLTDAHMMMGRRVLTLPGFFRPTKLWDLLIVNDGRLVAALELKSQVGSFGKNFNNRTEEAIGTAVDLWTAYREGAFGPEAPRPFVAWLMPVEDAPESRSPVNDTSPHFPVFPDFRGASYIERYNILCRKLVQERLYTTATIMASPRTAAETGDYVDLSELTGLKTFVTSFAGHIAAEAARAPPGAPDRLL
ncbi:PaeR7I family type II restriction endonuclease [Methylocystis parvus]|uniref:Type-2 restriction enzyme n=1 Tax=Methylocystis parvus TaxID=134 RepID=A0A6B8MBP3_9HYPH|nr:PaeR7I family type II restriction endonuclease [Methylocystis parvus]QGN00029.1 restriction endonuclease [Methylocystis parvus]WBK02473.1 PaeR7I family type II restriction endonuclease [Methylocystis parvus OBBP]